MTDRTTLLAEDFGFKQAIATNEEDTIISVLGNHGDRIGADLILLADTQADIQISTHELSDGLALREGIAGSTGPFSLLMIAEGSPYQLVMVPVRAPLLIAWVGMVFELDTQLLAGFREITKADVTLLFRDSKAAPVRVLSTLDWQWSQPSTTGHFDQALMDIDNELSADGWLNRQSDLLDGENQQLGMILSASLQEALAAYNALQTQVLLIALAALALATAATVLVALRITRPISELVRSARRIGRGDYEGDLALRRKDEFGVLADTLNSMQGVIKEPERHIVYQARHDLLTDLINAMTEAGVGVGAQNDLLARLAPMHDEVVNARKYWDDESLTPRF